MDEVSQREDLKEAHSSRIFNAIPKCPLHIFNDSFPITGKKMSSLKIIEIIYPLKQLYFGARHGMNEFYLMNQENKKMVFQCPERHKFPEHWGCSRNWP